MDIDGPVGRRTALVDRAKNILLKPKEEWLAIDAERGDIAGIFMSYVVPLAAIPTIAGLIGRLVFGISLFGITYRPSIASAIGTAVVQYALALAGTFVLALIIDALAPTFGGTKDRVQAYKIAAYSSTAAWLAGIFAIIPALAILGIVGLYSLYLLYLGLPLLMRAPADKAAGYAITTIVAAIVMFLIIGAITGAVTSRFTQPLASPDGQLSGTVGVPGVGTVDLGKLQAASKQIQESAQQVTTASNGGAPVAVIPPATLQAMLPAALGAYHRTEVSSASASAAGIGGSHAEARYENGGSAIHLEVTDMAAAGAIAALGGALNVQSSSQTATGYEKTATVDGRMTSEKWDTASKNGSYSTVVGNRFMVEAEGTAGSIDELKQAVASVPLGDLEKLAKN
jgi:hypothetical protein